MNKLSLATATGWKSTPNIYLFKVLTWDGIYHMKNSLGSLGKHLVTRIHIS